MAFPGAARAWARCPLLEQALKLLSSTWVFGDGNALPGGSRVQARMGVNLSAAQSFPPLGIFGNGISGLTLAHAGAMCRQSSEFPSPSPLWFFGLVPFSVPVLGCPSGRCPRLGSGRAAHLGIDGDGGSGLGVSVGRMSCRAITGAGKDDRKALPICLACVRDVPFSRMSCPLLSRLGFSGLAGLPLNGRSPVLCGSQPWRCLVPYLCGSGLAMPRLVGISGNVVALPCLEKALCGDFTRTFSAPLVGSGRFWPVPLPSGRLRVSWSGPWWGFWRGVLFLSLLVLGWLIGSLALAVGACARGGRSPFVITLAVLRGLARMATVKRFRLGLADCGERFGGRSLGCLKRGAHKRFIRSCGIGPQQCPYASRWALFRCRSVWRNSPLAPCNSGRAMLCLARKKTVASCEKAGRQTQAHKCGFWRTLS